MDSVLLWDGSSKTPQLLAFTQESAVDTALSSLLSTIATDPLWQQLPNAQLVARHYPVPLVAAFGHFSPFERARLKNLASLLGDALEHHRYIDYHHAEQLAERLAACLEQRFSRDEIRALRFAAIPRGGHIVLGMLAYALDLDASQLCDIGTALNERHPAPVVIVDDCAISGVRLQEYLQRADDQTFVFASLLAPEGFRQALMSREARVIDCMSAETLVDLGPQRYNEGYAEWHSRQQSRMGEYGYWIGVSPHFAFAWSKPQSKYWNVDTQRFEASWRLQPARLCLAHRHSRPATPTAERISSCDPAGACVRLAERVLWVDVEGQVAVALMPLAGEADTTCFCLEGSAAAMWHAAVSHGDVEAAVTALQQFYSVERQTLLDDFEGFISALAVHGLVADEINA